MWAIMPRFCVGVGGGPEHFCGLAALLPYSPGKGGASFDCGPSFACSITGVLALRYVPVSTSSRFAEPTSGWALHRVGRSHGLCCALFAGKAAISRLEEDLAASSTFLFLGMVVPRWLLFLEITNQAYFPAGGVLFLSGMGQVFGFAFLVSRLVIERTGFLDSIRRAVLAWHRRKRLGGQARTLQ
jgi:hypothetical protein